MGNKESTKIIHHDGCECKLYAIDGHCCKTQCFFFADREKQKQQIINSLLKYNVEYLADIIMQYLPKFGIIKINPPYSDEGYNAYFHSHLIDTYSDNKAPCSIYLQYFTKQFEEFKIVLLGSGAVGKSALSIRIVCDSYNQYYDPTIEDSYRKQINLNGESIMYDILDTAGVQEFKSMQPQWIREGQFFLVCFSMNDKRTYDDAMERVQEIVKVKKALFMDENKQKNKKKKKKIMYGRLYIEWGMILVAMKCDELHGTNAKKTDIDQNEVIQQAKQWNVPYIEVSAKMKKNVELLFKMAFYEYWLQTQTKCTSIDVD